MFERLVHCIGFGWSVRAIGFMLFGLQLIALVTVKSFLNHVPKPLNIKEFLYPFRERPYLLNAIGCFFTMWGILIPFNYITLSGESSGISAELAVYIIPILNGARYPHSLPIAALHHRSKLTFIPFLASSAVSFPLGPGTTSGVSTPQSFS